MKPKRLIVLVILTSIFLIGCRLRRHVRRSPDLTSEAKRLILNDKTAARPALNLPDQAPLKLKDVKFIVVTENNIEEIFAKMEDQKEVKVLFALKSGEYKVLGLNQRLLIKYIAYQKKVIVAYKNYYESASKTKITTK